MIRISFWSSFGKENDSINNYSIRKFWKEPWGNCPYSSSLLFRYEKQSHGHVRYQMVMFEYHAQSTILTHIFFRCTLKQQYASRFDRFGKDIVFRWQYSVSKIKLIDGVSSHPFDCIDCPKFLLVYKSSFLFNKIPSPSLLYMIISRHLVINYVWLISGDQSDWWNLFKRKWRFININTAEFASLQNAQWKRIPSR